MPRKDPMNDSLPDFPNDPRLTAYALGELEGAEHAEVEALVRSNLAAAAAVAEMRRLASSLADALEDEDIGSQPMAEVVPIESGRQSWPRRIQPYLYVASGLAAGWAAALLIFRPAPRPRVASQVYPIGLPAVPAVGTNSAEAWIPGQVPNIAVVTKQEMSPIAPAVVPMTPAPSPPPVLPLPVPTPIVDSMSMRQDLKAFEMVQPALGAGARIALDKKTAPEPIKDEGTVALSPFEVQSSAKDKGYYAQNTLSGTRLNSKLSDLGGSVAVQAKAPELARAERKLKFYSSSPPAADQTGAATFGLGSPDNRVEKDYPSLLPLAAAGQAGAPAPAASAGPFSYGPADAPLRDLDRELRQLRVIDGAQPGHPEIPGRFSQLFPQYVFHGSQADFERMMADPNPEVSAMGALCLLSQYPSERVRVLAKMDSDLRPITYARAGAEPLTSTLGSLFRLIEADPNYLFFFGAVPRRP